MLSQSKGQKMGASEDKGKAKANGKVQKTLRANNKPKDKYREAHDQEPEGGAPPMTHSQKGLVSSML